MKNMLLYFFLTVSSLIQAQEQDSIIEFINCPPQFPGGDKALVQFISTNFDYNSLNPDKFEHGRIYLTFWVEKDGSTSQLKILSREKENLLLEDTVLFPNMPKWIPGCDRNGPTRERVTIPINLDP